MRLDEAYLSLLRVWSSIYITPAAIGAPTHHSVGHEVMPLQFPAAVVFPVEVFHFRNAVFELNVEKVQKNGCRIYSNKFRGAY